MKSWGDLDIMEGFPVTFVEVIKCEEVVNLISNTCLALIYGWKRKKEYIQFQLLLFPVFNQLRNILQGCSKNSAGEEF